MAENTNGIIDAILSKADEDASKIIAVAEQYAAAKIADAQRQADEFLSAEREETARKCAFIMERGASNARIDRKKAITGAKIEVIDGIFQSVKQMLADMPLDEAARFFIALIGKYAETGDKVLVAPRHAECAEEIKKSEVYSQKMLSVEVDNCLSDGIVLCGEKADKDFTFDAIVAFYKEQLSASTAAELFAATEEQE